MPGAESPQEVGRSGWDRRVVGERAQVASKVALVDLRRAFVDPQRAHIPPDPGHRMISDDPGAAQNLYGMICQSAHHFGREQFRRGDLTEAVRAQTPSHLSPGRGASRWR